MQAWHFLSKDKRLGYDDGRAVEVGVPLECKGEPKLCENGMHGSVRLIDALFYAAGPIVCRVEVEGDVIQGDDKLCGRRRTVLWMLDATRILHEFACQCADDALALVEEHDPSSVAAVEAKRKWLAGEITDEELAVARAAAVAAARDAALDAARAATSDAAWSASAAARAAAAAAAWATADAAASDAAWAAARDAAWDAAAAAARSAWSAARDAALDAAAAAARSAWSAALDAEREKQDARLTEMVMAAHEREDE